MLFEMISVGYFSLLIIFSAIIFFRPSCMNRKYLRVSLIHSLISIAILVSVFSHKDYKAILIMLFVILIYLLPSFFIILKEGLYRKEEKSISD